MILIVDDNESDVELTLRALRKSQVDLECVVVEDGREALDYLLGADGSESGQLPDLVLMDINLPKVNGLDVLRRIRMERRTRRLPVVILTSSIVAGDVATCYDLGANGYIHKPINFTEFVEHIQQMVKFWLEINVRPPAVEG
jgi:two-component system response regulator